MLRRASRSDVDAFTEKSGYLFELSVSEVDSLGEYDVAKIAAIFRRRPLLVVGGPRFDESMAAQLGVDRIFGKGTTPAEVASYLVHRIVGEGRA